MKILFAAFALMFSMSAFAGSSDCPSGYWWSYDYQKCFKKHGHCSQYNYTDTKTCNTSKDYLKCDWNHSSSTCYEESGHGGGNNHCKHDEWYSHDYKKCFKKYGHCGQYNHTDHKTCNTGKDRLKCDWDHQYRKCYEEHK